MFLFCMVLFLVYYNNPAVMNRLHLYICILNLYCILVEAKPLRTLVQCHALLLVSPWRVLLCDWDEIFSPKGQRLINEFCGNIFGIYGSFTRTSVQSLHAACVFYYACWMKDKQKVWAETVLTMWRMNPLDQTGFQ